MFKKILALTLTVLMLATLCVSFASCGGSKDEAKDTTAAATNAATTASAGVDLSDVKVGFIFLHDENSTYDKNFIDAANRAKTALGLRDDQIILRTNIPEGNECYETAKELAQAGCDIVFADSFGHEQFMIQAAEEFPNVQFCHATGTMAHTEELDNFHNAFASIYEGRYLAGVAAGLKLNEMIAAGKITAEQAIIGYVGAWSYAEVISGFTSFFLGARSICPSVTMKVQFTGSWYDLALEQEAAETLINTEHCVLISQHADSMGAPGACETAGVPNVSYNGSTVERCPNTFIVSSAINWTPYFEYIINCVATDTAIATDWTGTIETGSVVLSDVNTTAAAAGTVEKIAEVKAKLQSGEIKVFDTATFKKDGAALTTYMADVNTDDAFTPDTEAIANGYFHESEYRSAPYFDIQIDGITWLNAAY